MENTPTFELKQTTDQKERRESLPPENLPLGELAADKQTVQNFTYFFNGVILNTFGSTNELKARFEGRLENDFLVDKAGERVLDKNGQFIDYRRRDDLKALKITDET